LILSDAILQAKLNWLPRIKHGKLITANVNRTMPVGPINSPKLNRFLLNLINKISTGNDIERATELARNMVTKWGLSQRLGPLAYSEEEGEVFLGRSVTQHKSVAEETAHTIDEEIRSIIDRNYERAEKILKENEDILHAMAEALMKYETIDKYQIDDLMARKKPVREPQGWDDTPQPPKDGESVEVQVEEKGKKKAGPSIDGAAEQH